MRILHLNDRISERGGADLHLLGVIDFQVAVGHDVILAAGRLEITRNERCSVVKVEGLDARDRRPVALARLVDEMRPDVLHVHNIMNPEALEAAADHGAVMTVQDHRTFCPGRGKWTLDEERCEEPLSKDLCRKCFTDEAYLDDVYALTRARLAALSRMRQLTVLSEYMRGELIGAGIVPERITVIPPFVVDLDLDAKPAGPPCVLFVGRVVLAKGVIDAAEAWRRAQTDLPFVAVGTGSARADLERMGVEVIGWRPHCELAELYRRARVVVLPSRWQEPFGIVGLEALTMGTPVAAWHSGGVHEWHPGPLPPWGDVDGLAACIRELQGSPAQPPSGFEPVALMKRLDAVYAAHVARASS